MQKAYNIVINYNLAACYQRRGLFRDSQAFISKSLDHLTQLISHCSASDSPAQDYQCLLYERFYG